MSIRQFVRVALAILCVAPNSGAFALTTIDVTATPGAGKYAHPIYVTLKASDPRARIWYTCKRNGYPSDLFEYSGAILMNKSCALVYFGYINTQEESKIERSDYTLAYEEKVTLSGTAAELEILNRSDDTLDLGSWSVEGGGKKIVVEAGTTVTPGGKHVLPGPFQAGETYMLASPDGYAKGGFTLPLPPPPPPIVKPQPVETETPPANKEASDSGATTGSGETSGAVAENSSSGEILPLQYHPDTGTDAVIAPPPAPVEKLEPAPKIEDAANLKGSAAETSGGAKSNLPLYAFLSIVLLFGLYHMVTFVRRK